MRKHRGSAMRDTQLRHSQTGYARVQRPALRARAMVSRAECSAEGAARRPSAQRVVGRWWARCCGRDHSTCHQLHGACSGWGQLPVSCGCREAPHCSPHWLCGCAVEPSNHATVCYWRDKSVAPGVERGNVSSGWCSTMRLWPNELLHGEPYAVVSALLPRRFRSEPCASTFIPVVTSLPSDSLAQRS